jgi:hypothetical protein
MSRGPASGVVADDGGGVATGTKDDERERGGVRGVGVKVKESEEKDEHDERDMQTGELDRGDVDDATAEDADDRLDDESSSSPSVVSSPLLRAFSVSSTGSRCE